MAASTLGELGVLGALPDLQTALTDRRKYSRILAVQAIARFGKEAASAVGDLGKLLEDPDDDVRRAAVAALGAIGAAARPLATRIARELDSENDRLRKAAEESIERIGGSAAESTKAARAEAFRVRDLVAAKNFIAGSKIDDLAKLLDQLPSERKLALSRALQDHEMLRVAYIANASLVLHTGEDSAVRKVIEISLQDQNGPELLRGLTWSIIHGAGEVNAEEVIAKLAGELQSQLKLAPQDVQDRFTDVGLPGGDGRN
jgi:HEAT repeat protein